jgi:hypothetical protein
MCIAGLGEGLFALIDAIGSAAPEIAGAAGAGLAGAGAAGAFGGADATTAGLADTASTGAGSGVDQTSAALPSSAGATAGTGAGGAGVDTAMLPEINVTAASEAPGTAGALAAGGGTSGLAGAVPAAAALAGGAGGGGSGVVGATGASPEGVQTAGVSQPADASGGFLPATSDSTVQSLSPDLASQFGIASPDATGVSGFSGATTDPGMDFGLNQGATESWDPTSMDTMDWTGGGAGTGGASADGTSGGGFLQGLGQDASKYLGNFKNDASVGLLGLSLKNALSKPKLPGASGLAGANAGAATQGALSTIQSGGTATPEWSAQKSSIDGTIDQQIKQQTQAIMQAAASNGEGGQNSGIVQQQIAQMTQNANVQRQNLYAQAQQQNVSAALSALSGGDATLTSIGNMQMQQSEQANQLAAQTAAMALQLQTGQKIPSSSGNTGIPTGS